MRVGRLESNVAASKGFRVLGPRESLKTCPSYLKMFFAFCKLIKKQHSMISGSVPGGYSGWPK